MDILNSCLFEQHVRENRLANVHLLRLRPAAGSRCLHEIGGRQGSNQGTFLWSYSCHHRVGMNDLQAYLLVSFLCPHGNAASYERGLLRETWYSLHISIAQMLTVKFKSSFGKSQSHTDGHRPVTALMS